MALPSSDAPNNDEQPDDWKGQPQPVFKQRLPGQPLTPPRKDLERPAGSWAAKWAGPPKLKPQPKSPPLSAEPDDDDDQNKRSLDAPAQILGQGTPKAPQDKGGLPPGGLIVRPPVKAGQRQDIVKGGACWDVAKKGGKGAPWNGNGCFGKGESSGFGGCGGLGGGCLSDSVPLAEQWPDAVCKKCWSPLPSQTSICGMCASGESLEANLGLPAGSDQQYAKGRPAAAPSLAQLPAFPKVVRPPTSSAAQLLLSTPKVPPGLSSPPGLGIPSPPGLGTTPPPNVWPNGQQAPPGLGPSSPPGLNIPSPPGLGTTSPPNGWPSGQQVGYSQPPAVQPIPCRNFAMGTCTYGAGCAFFHGVKDEVQPEVTQLCRYFAQGECVYGEGCAFSHDSSKLQAELSKPAMEVSPILCKNFQNGDCKYGAWCGYKHISNPLDLPMEAAPPVNPASSSTLPPPASAGPQAVTGPAWMPQLEDALREVLGPVANLDEQWSLDDMIRHCVDCISKIAAKFHKDERRNETASSLQAQALCGQFVRETMKSLAQVCSGKAWLPSINFGKALELSARNIFRSGKVFSRTAATSIKGFVDESLFRLKEEDRVEQLMKKAVNAVGNLVPAPFDQLALAHLQGAYDDVHLNAPWGSHGAPSTTDGLPSLELGLVEDFVKGWMVEFIKRAQLDVLPCVGQSADEQVTFVTLLFEFLTNSQTCAIPYDLVSSLTVPLPQKWPFVHQSAMNILMGMAPPEPGFQSRQSSQGATQVSASQTAPAQQLSFPQAIGTMVGSFVSVTTAPSGI